MEVCSSPAMITGYYSVAIKASALIMTSNRFQVALQCLQVLAQCCCLVRENVCIDQCCIVCDMCIAVFSKLLLKYFFLTF